MSSTWRPSEGLQRAELLVQVLEAEAPAAGAKITPVFRHRMVEQIARVFDNTMPVTNGLLQGQLEASKELLEKEFQTTTVSVGGVVPAQSPTTTVVGGVKPKGRRGRPPKAK